jgi:Eukaryotic aspartyl protease
LIIPSINCTDCLGGPFFNQSESNTYRNSGVAITVRETPVYSKTQSLTTYGWIYNDTVKLGEDNDIEIVMNKYKFIAAKNASTQVKYTYFKYGAWLGMAP